MTDLGQLAHDATERNQVVQALGTLSACYGVRLHEITRFNYRVVVETEDTTTTHYRATLDDAALLMVKEMLRIEQHNPERAAKARTDYALLTSELVQRKGT